ncbi:MAG: VWA domain-containing protein [Candidatus Kapabacteria bacterium]|nr:VWA domain-containing protein [Candidatus Kapabacteria bacterium]
MKARFGIISYLFFISIFCNLKAAQFFNYYQLDNSQFPIVKMSFVSKSPGGDKYDFFPADFAITENGRPIPASDISVDCSEKKDSMPVQIMIIWDISQSMSGSSEGIARMEWARQGILRILDSIKFVPKTKMGIITFNTTNTLGMDFTSDKAALINFVNNAKVSPYGTNFAKAFLGASTNVFTKMAATDPDVPRYILFITDGEPDQLFNEPDITNIWKAANTNKTIINEVTMIDNINANMSSILKYSGGHNYPVPTRSDINAVFGQVAGVMQERSYCQLVWKAPFGCDQASKTRNYNLNNTILSVAKSGSYIAPDSSIGDLKPSVPSMLFGKTGVGDTIRTVSFKAINLPYTITGVNFSIDKEVFVQDWGGSAPPFTLNPGESRTLRLWNFGNISGQSHIVNLSLVGDVANICPISNSVNLVIGCNVQPLVSYDFTNVQVKLSSTKVITGSVKNLTNAKLTIKPTISGTDAADFAFTGTVPSTLDIGQAIDLSIKFSPLTEGIKNAVIDYGIPAECGKFSTIIKGTGIPDPKGVNDNFSLSSNLSMRLSPNPASEQTQLIFSSELSGNGKIEILNQIGTIEKYFNITNQSGEENTIDLNTSDLNSSVYFIKLSVGAEVLIKKLLITK